MSGRGTGPTVTVMTYNVGNGLAPPEQLVALLQQADADVIGLQELDAVQAAALARHLIDIYPHQTLTGSGFSGRGLLSRYPILDEERLPLLPDRPDLRAVVDVAGHPLTILVAHPPPPRLGRRGVVFDVATLAQIEQLAVAALDAAPAVLLGDFNMTARNPSYAALAALGLVDAYEVAGMGRGPTFPLRPGHTRRIRHRLTWVPLPPVARLDYIWHTADFIPLAAWVGQSAGSDHLPVLARLALPGEPSGSGDRLLVSRDRPAPGEGEPGVRSDRRPEPEQPVPAETEPGEPPKLILPPGTNRPDRPT